MGGVSRGERDLVATVFFHQYVGCEPRGSIFRCKRGAGIVQIFAVKYGDHPIPTAMRMNLAAYLTDTFELQEPEAYLDWRFRRDRRSLIAIHSLPRLGQY